MTDMWKNETFEAALTAAYSAARTGGRWSGTYAMATREEYWAEGAQVWFQCNPMTPDWQHNDVNTRDKLRAYDPALAALLSYFFSDREVVYQCPRL